MANNLKLYRGLMIGGFALGSAGVAAMAGLGIYCGLVGRVSSQGQIALACLGAAAGGGFLVGGLELSMLRQARRGDVRPPVRTVRQEVYHLPKNPAYPGGQQTPMVITYG